MNYTNRNIINSIRYPAEGKSAVRRVAEETATTAAIYAVLFVIAIASGFAIGYSLEYLGELLLRLDSIIN